jgi:OmpR family response regulator RpaB
MMLKDSTGEDGMSVKRILLIEDTKAHAQNITDRLSHLGYELTIVYTGPDGLAAARAVAPNLIILDIRLETDEEGFDVLRTLQADPSTCDIPVIIYSVTAKDMENRLRGLHLGALWCLDKNDGITELEATVRRALRLEAQRSQAPASPHRLPLDFDRRSGTIWIDGRKAEIKLTLLQARLLDCLAEHAGEICSRDDISQYVYKTEVSNEVIDRLVSRLREKLADSSKQPRFIENVRGVGYKLIAHQPADREAGA